MTTSVNELFELLRTGDRGALGKAITLVESTRSQDRDPAKALLAKCAPFSGKANRLGITGIPGVGKSTLIDALGTELIQRSHKVAVLAIDPSSVTSGGSILGDKTRMEKLGQNDAAFIRPTSTAGTLGGVARRTRETIALCEAAGYDRILIETVGVGQSELEVDRMTDLNLLLMIAGAGDELQGIKRGIMETADIVAITKTASQELQRAKNTQRDLINAIHYLPKRMNGRHPQVLLTDALANTGITELTDHIEELFSLEQGSGTRDAKRKEQDRYWLMKAVEAGLLERFREDPKARAAMDHAEKAVDNGADPFSAAEDVLASI
ncbi:MAG TPA: methylmalonyl Co-A mutase-associated GTPase MeaB [Flavobacteriales bacterium]|nr:methylmalonyl Co-A mutase-associated GTPase MeaB [Flavobacteriales bacterium]MBP9138005.1 methylmalonyl Co-A mutase-associated GTPase MeaB [Flavobacteriales bacterium]HQV52525.1 methylmalonyl Co-A mutase-associated GTPase MeaB [Flavobacteriales bacterium]HQX29513.1 methylmalonyl Co-A mutase-associated GTPase MeaB [Flavobacteriales bacterium]HQX39079.1 methylmalonyl Co-A mutase-associated GTPase MeaB [Flavobacteriales bacterium]